MYHIPISKETKDLSAYKDQFLLVVNIASRCGFHYQLDALIKLHQSSIPCRVIAFPSNQFHQHDTQMCRVDIPFKVESLIDVNGENTHPLFQYLKYHARGLFFQECICWNYTKFLIAPNELFIRRFAPITSIQRIEEYIVRNVP